MKTEIVSLVRTANGVPGGGSFLCWQMVQPGGGGYARTRWTTVDGLEQAEPDEAQIDWRSQIVLYTYTLTKSETEGR